MIKMKIALGALLMAFALTPASAVKKTQNPPKAGQAGKAGKANDSAKGGKSVKLGTAVKGGKGVKADKVIRSGKAGKAGKAAVAAKHDAKAQPDSAAPAELKAPAAERRQDHSLDMQRSRFFTALWRIDPESAISAGKFDTAAILTIPDSSSREQKLIFIDAWLTRFAKFDARQLSARQRTDLALLINKLNADRWRLTSLREFEWNPAAFNIAPPLDAILNTEYAAQPQRLRTLLKRIANVPAYYQAARAGIVDPTREHTRLAIGQSAGVATLLGELERVALASILSPVEKQLYTQRIGAAQAAVDAYVLWLGKLDNTFDLAGARPFRLGKDLYEQKFAYDLQSSTGPGELYQKALGAREQVLLDMNGLADELWSKTMGDAAKPAGREEKIAMVIDKLSANHVAPADYLPEIRRQIPLLRDWVGRQDLLALDPKQALLVREAPLYQRGLADAGIKAPGPYRAQDLTYYDVSPLDHDMPGQAESKLREYNQWILQISTMHETVPGHFAQMVYANRSESIVKSLFGNRAMMEGWAAYGERMMLESGYGENTPEMRLMYSKWHLRSISAAILDHGVHVLGMTQEQALAMLTRQAFQSPREAAENWRRAQLTSVHPSASYSGYSEIMELREQRKQALGNRFVLKDFHQQVLSYGSAPVGVIKELMQ
jgi:hypothetical protein